MVNQTGNKLHTKSEQRMFPIIEAVNDFQLKSCTLTKTPIIFNEAVYTAKSIPYLQCIGNLLFKMRIHKRAE